MSTSAPKSPSALNSNKSISKSTETKLNSVFFFQIPYVSHFTSVISVVYGNPCKESSLHGLFSLTYCLSLSSCCCHKNVLGMATLRRKGLFWLQLKCTGHHGEDSGWLGPEAAAYTLFTLSSHHKCTLPFTSHFLCI